MARRHLPVLQSSPSPPVTTPVSETPDAPPWHWIPMGTVVSVVTFALLAQGAASLSVRILARVYPPHSTAAQVASLRALHGATARATELVAGLVPLVALLAAVALGGFVAGRYGEATRPQHGALSGVCTTVLLWAVTGRLAVMLAVVPVAAMVGALAARGGVALRARA